MNLKNKRGISVIIGYVLLVAVVISISVVVYQWLRSYVPTSALTCPDGVSISIPTYVYNCSSSPNSLNFTWENTGTFDIAGYSIYATNNSGQTIATIDLSKYYNGTSSTYENMIWYEGIGVEANNEKPGAIVDKSVNGFYIPSSIGRLYSIEVTPIRYVNYSGQKRFANCGNAKITQTLTCTS